MMARGRRYGFLGIVQVLFSENSTCVFLGAGDRFKNPSQIPQRNGKKELTAIGESAIINTSE